MRNEIALKEKSTAFKIAELLVDEDYVVMISKEENLYVVSFEWSNGSDRNDVVFMNKEEFEERYVEIENLDENNYDIIPNAQEETP